MSLNNKEATLLAVDMLRRLPFGVRLDKSETVLLAAWLEAAALDANSMPDDAPQVQLVRTMIDFGDES